MSGKKKDEIESLSDRMSSMHLHHIPVNGKDKESCKEKFQAALKKWTGSARRRKSYNGVCHSKEDKQCKYVIKVFQKDDHKNPALFRHEIRVLRDLEKLHLNISPHVHQMFACGLYGLVVMDKWDGDLLELIFSQRHFTEIALRHLYMKVRDIVSKLHQAGWVHGRINFQNIIFRGEQLGLVSWAHAQSLSNVKHHSERDALLIKSDMHAIDILFMELGQTVQAIEKGMELPENLPIALKHRFKKI